MVCIRLVLLWSEPFLSVFVSSSALWQRCHPVWFAAKKKKKTCNMILLEYWDIARGHSDIAALSVFSVCHALHLVSDYHALFLFPLSCLDLLLTWAFLSLPHHHLLSLFHPFTDYGSLCICLSTSLPLLHALFLFTLIQAQKKHTGCKLISHVLGFFCAIFHSRLYCRSVEMARMSLNPERE